jgi:hypothetical protein
MTRPDLVLLRSSTTDIVALALKIREEREAANIAFGNAVEHAMAQPDHLRDRLLLGEMVRLLERGAAETGELIAELQHHLNARKVGMTPREAPPLRDDRRQT